MQCGMETIEISLLSYPGASTHSISMRYSTKMPKQNSWNSIPVHVCKVQLAGVSRVLCVVSLNKTVSHKEHTHKSQ